MTENFVTINTLAKNMTSLADLSIIQSMALCRAIQDDNQAPLFEYKGNNPFIRSIELLLLSLNTVETVNLLINLRQQYNDFDMHSLLRKEAVGEVNVSEVSPAVQALEEVAEHQDQDGQDRDGQDSQDRDRDGQDDDPDQEVVKSDKLDQAHQLARIESPNNSDVSSDSNNVREPEEVEGIYVYENDLIAFFTDNSDQWWFLSSSELSELFGELYGFCDSDSIRLIENLRLEFLRKKIQNLERKAQIADRLSRSRSSSGNMLYQSEEMRRRAERFGETHSENRDIYLGWLDKPLDELIIKRNPKLDVNDEGIDYDDRIWNSRHIYKYVPTDSQTLDKELQDYFTTKCQKTNCKLCKYIPRSSVSLQK